MPEFGFALSSELHRPNELVEYAAYAEEVGFDYLTISDHYHPWISEQGESPFVWGTLGGVAQEIESIPVATGVTCPIMRIHPAIVAQAAATAAAMLPGEFSLGVGTGEALNEHVLGDHWPEHEVRLEMMEEAVAVIRKLWSGENVSHHGKHYDVENAKVFTLPDETPDIPVSAYGERAANTAAEIGDGLVSVGPQEDVAATYDDAGGEGPRYAQMTLSYADSEGEAVEAAYERWPNTALAGELSGILPTPKHFEQAVQMVEKEDIAEGSTVTDPDPDTHIENVQQFEEAGYSHVTLHQVAPDVEGVLDFYAEEVMPSF
ncbi:MULTISPECIES: TIGR03557 family F420-dependent LLM class oxidoreductase [Halostella]|uniref:TIGR03557 family F420-dependent LLM class oxidoreductase n=1 Tax=Halostella TaxID=1843185 RepID=UPI0010810EDD|nr:MULTISPECIES: TIGR03557 family F420-dependent LLM class oxidoreductase [Halostella]